MKIQAERIKPNVYVHIIPDRDNFKDTFENTNNFVKYLRTAAPVKCYL